MGNSFSSLHILNCDCEAIKKFLMRKNKKIPDFVYTDKVQNTLRAMDKAYSELFECHMKSIDTIYANNVFFIEKNNNCSIFFEDMQLESIEYFVEKYFNKKKLQIFGFGVFDGYEAGLIAFNGKEKVGEIHIDISNDGDFFELHSADAVAVSDFLNVPLEDIERCFFKHDLLEASDCLSKLLSLPLNYGFKDVLCLYDRSAGNIIKI